jgi:hypothetical protein
MVIPSDNPQNRPSNFVITLTCPYQKLNPVSEARGAE